MVEQAAPPTQQERCMPCGGRGVVYATVEGERRQQRCPWCEGTGIAAPDHDAQSRWLEPDAGQAPAV